MRSRNIKAGFYKSDQLLECSLPARYMFPGLWMMADREGRLEYRPKKIKVEIYPDDDFDIEALLAELSTNGLIVIYEVDEKKYIWIPKFLEHQNPHKNEKPSVLPSPDLGEKITVSNHCDTDNSLQGINKFAPRSERVEPRHNSIGLNPESGILNPDKEKVNQKESDESYPQAVTKAVDDPPPEPKQTRPKKTREPLPDPPEWIARDDWDAFIQSRIRQKKPLSPEAARRLIAKLDKLKNEGHDPSELLNEAVINSWQSVWPKTQPRASPDKAGKYDMNKLPTMEEYEDEARKNGQIV